MVKIFIVFLTGFLIKFVFNLIRDIEYIIYVREYNDAINILNKILWDSMQIKS